MIYRTYITEASKFDYNTLTMDDEIALSLGGVLLTPEIAQGFANRTLCWEDGEIVPYEETQEEKEVRLKDQERREILLCIGELKTMLQATDYKAIKYAEGELSEYEYAPIKAQRAEWRRQINELEKKI